MNNEIKVNLSITLQGGVMLSKQECLKNPKESYDTFSIEVSDANKKNREIITVKTRKRRTIRQSLNLSVEAYNHMVSNECPFFIKPKQWAAMNAKMRLEAHLQRISEGLGGISYTYEIFE